MAFQGWMIGGLLAELFLLSEMSCAGAMPCATIRRKHGISSATFFKWKSKYGGLEVSDARRLKVLEDENRS